MTRTCRLALQALVSSLLSAVVWGQSSLPAQPAGDPRVRYDGHRLVLVELRTDADIQTMLSISTDSWADAWGIGTVPFRVPPERLADLNASGLSYTILHDNIQELIDAEAASRGSRGGWFDDYHPYTEVNAYLDTLVALRPDLALKINLGTSLEGRSIYGIRITGPDGPLGKPALLYNGCQHAREWVAVMVPMYIADRLIRTYDTDAVVRAMLADAVVYVVPIVNPDGYVYAWGSDRMWRKNRRNNGDGSFGVDNNRNWGYQWGGAGSSGNGFEETYRGTAPFSEPETQRMRDFVLAHGELVGHIDFHSYGQLVMSPWGYTVGEPSEPDRTLFRDINSLMEAEIEHVHGQEYVSGPIGSTLYLAAGNAVDWVYGGAGVLSWTIELRPNGTPGFLLPADEIIPTAEENWAAIVALGQATVGGVIVSFPNGTPSYVPADEATTIAVQIDEYSASVPAGQALLFSRVGNAAFTSAPLSPQGGGQYSGTLPATPCGETLEFYIQVLPTSGILVHEPPGAPDEPFSLPALQTVLVDSMEADSGWTVGAAGDDATTGLWNRMDPEATAAQPGDDATVNGAQCWVTDGRAGSGVGTYDVDGGQTTLTSPTFDLSGASDPYIQYARWYSNDQGGAPNADVFVVDISFDNGASWTNVETVGPSGPDTVGGWRTHSFRVADFGAPTAGVRLRFIASDEGSGSIIEAAIDELVLTDACAPSCLTDLDGSGTTDLGDLSLLLAAYGACVGDGAYNAAADFDASGCIDLGDLSTLLAEYGLPCE